MLERASPTVRVTLWGVGVIRIRWREELDPRYRQAPRCRESLNRRYGNRPGERDDIFIDCDVARHGSSSVNGGRFTPPAAPTLGLYESTDGGTTFTLAFSLPADTPDGGTVNGADFFRGGVSNVRLYRARRES